MTNFARVNSGSAFSTNQVLTSTHANDLRVNSELLWQNNAFRFIGRECDVTGFHYQASGVFGPLTYHFGHHQYIAASRDPSGVGQCVAFAPADGPAMFAKVEVAENVNGGVLSYTPVFMASTDRYYYEMIGTGATSVAIYKSTDFATWTSAATLSGFTPYTTSAPATANTYTAIPGANASTYGSIAVASCSAGTVTLAKGDSSTYPTMQSIATNGTIAAAVGQGSTGGMYITLAGAASPTDFAITLHGDASTNTRIAYDYRLSQWVLFANQAASAGGLYWCTQSTPGWSSGTWKKFSTGYTYCYLLDFKITASGVWLALCSVQSSGLWTNTLFVSIDGGSNWSVQKLLTTKTATSVTADMRFGSNSATSFETIISRPSSSSVAILTSGLLSNGTLIASTTA